MSSIEVSTVKLDSDTEHHVLRPQRPPPPPPTQSELSTPIEQTPITPELVAETVLPSTDTCLEDARPSLLFEFNELFDSFDYGSIRNKILNRQMITCPFTSVLWRIFLHCLPRDSSQWNQIIDSSRDNYNELVDKYLLDLKKIREHNVDAEHLNHPLSQAENSPWHQYYINADLKDNIYQDVIRTCQEISFFRQKDVLELLLRVLYIHSRHYEQTLPYRQGMHEILAVIVYVIHMESVTINEYSESSEMMTKLYDPNYLAHDSFAIYEKIMEHLQQFYDFKPNNAGARKNIRMSENKQILFQRSYDIQVQLNDTVMRVNSIFERLKDYDVSLYDKLVDLNIEPMVYGIRWLRLLFGREIPFGSIPRLWTIIFCYDGCFGFVDYFFIALLIDIGQSFKKLGISEYSFCLQFLMRPNAISDVDDIIGKALDLEKDSRNKEFNHSSSNSLLQSISNRSIITDTQRPTSPIQNFSQNPIINSIRNFSSSAFIPSSQISKPVSSNASNGSEMDFYPGKEIRQRFDDNFQIQKYCADFINKFINRIRSHICDLQSANEEEVLIQLNGLKQIADVLDGTLAFDDNSLQALVNYKSKEEPVENENNDTDG